MIDFDALRGLLVPYCQAIGLKLRKVGPSTLVGRCQIHQEKHGLSFAVFGERRWCCFGKCDRGGDVVDLDRELNGGQIADALKRLEGMDLGPPLPVDQYDAPPPSETAITSENPLGRGLAQTR